MSQQRGPRGVPVLRLSIAELLRGEERVGLGQLVVMPRNPSCAMKARRRRRRGKRPESVRRRLSESIESGSHRVARDGAGFPQRCAVVYFRGDEDARDDVLPVSRLAS